MKPYGVCPNFQSRPPTDHRPPHLREGADGGHHRTDPKLLLLVETAYSRLGRELAETLVHNRLRYEYLTILYRREKYMRTAVVQANSIILRDAGYAF